MESVYKKMKYSEEVHRTIKYSYPSVNQIDIYQDYDYQSNNWHSFLRASMIHHESSIENIFAEIEEVLKKDKNYKINKNYSNFINKIKKEYTEYQTEAEEKKIKAFKPVGIDSLFQMLRFMPELTKKDLNIYLDADTGCFGVVLQVNNSTKSFLNLLMQNNGEVIFSLIERHNKIVKVSGRAYFNDDYRDSNKIKKLFRLIHE